MTKYIDDSIWNLERAPECFFKLIADQQLDYQLPKVGSSTGAIVRHAIDTFERMHRRHAPMVFKFGWTHDAENRFRNRKYGYCWDRHQKWQTMVVIYASCESIGPAFLEALLIEKFKGDSIEALTVSFFDVGAFFWK